VLLGPAGLGLIVVLIPFFVGELMLVAVAIANTTRERQLHCFTVVRRSERFCYVHDPLSTHVGFLPGHHGECSYVKVSRVVVRWARISQPE
jgi:cob(I)alamin adenosyltransferase